jgi:hypothetical protein
LQPRDRLADIDKSFSQKTIVGIIEDLCAFTMREIISFQGEYNDKSITSSDPKLLALSDVASLNLGREDY